MLPLKKEYSGREAIPANLLDYYVVNEHGKWVLHVEPEPPPPPPPIRCRKDIAPNNVTGAAARAAFIREHGADAYCALPEDRS